MSPQTCHFGDNQERIIIFGDLNMTSVPEGSMIWLEEGPLSYCPKKLEIYTLHVNNLYSILLLLRVLCYPSKRSRKTYGRLLNAGISAPECNPEKVLLDFEIAPFFLSYHLELMVSAAVSDKPKVLYREMEK